MTEHAARPREGTTAKQFAPGDHVVIHATVRQVTGPIAFAEGRRACDQLYVETATGHLLVPSHDAEHALAAQRRPCPECGDSMNPGWVCNLNAQDPASSSAWVRCSTCNPARPLAAQRVTDEEADKALDELYYLVGEPGPEAMARQRELLGRLRSRLRAAPSEDVVRVWDDAEVELRAAERDWNAASERANAAYANLQRATKRLAAALPPRPEETKP